MNKEELDEVLAQTESETLEFKRMVSLNSAAKLITALANTDGGYVVVGVDERHKNRIVGVVDPAGITSLLQQAATLAEPPVDVTVKTVDVAGKMVVVGDIPDSTMALHFYRGLAYERIDHRTVPVTAGRVTRMALRGLPAGLDSDAEDEVLHELAKLAGMVESLNSQLSEARNWRNRMGDLAIGGGMGAVMSLVLALLFN